MRTLRRLAKDESGVTLALAVIMIVLIGVMGAGLLTFSMRDLNTVVEDNRAQRAFELADAGIAAAKVQLASNVVTTDYNDPIKTPLAPDDDIQWSAAAGGLTLNDLDEDDATADSVNVKIKYKTDTTEFQVISEGTYGVAKRRIEAIFGPPDFDPSAAGQKGQPVYYTPSSIMIDGPDVGIKGISLFSRKDILIEDGRLPVTTAAYPYACFKADYEEKSPTTCPNMPHSNQTNHGTFASFNTNDTLCDWDSFPPTAGGSCFKEAIQQGKYNTVPRVTNKDVGFGAEGTICTVPPGSAGVPPASTDINGQSEVGIGACGTRPSIASAADGYTYDSHTNPTFVAKETLGLNPGRNGDDTPSGYITYPFPRLTPNPEYFRCVAKQENPKKCNVANSAGYWEGQPRSLPVKRDLRSPAAFGYRSNFSSSQLLQAALLLQTCACLGNDTEGGVLVTRKGPKHRRPSVSCRA